MFLIATDKYCNYTGLFLGDYILNCSMPNVCSIVYNYQ